MPKNVVIFASGTGSNAANLVELFADNPNINVTGICSNKPDAGVLTMAKATGIDTLVFSRAELEEGDLVDTFLKATNTDFVVLAGFLLRFPKRLVDQFRGRIINLHPALLPKFGGKGMYGMNVHRAVVEAGEKETGITVHYVNEHYDEGAIIAQFKCEVAKTDSAEDVFGKIRTLEKEHFPLVVKQVIENLSC